MRSDFFYRVHVIPIYLPPLRKRKEDIPLLAEHFFKAYDLKIRPMLTNRIMDTLMNYNWPGNVRELQNVLYRVRHPQAAGPCRGGDRAGQ